MISSRSATPGRRRSRSRPGSPHGWRPGVLPLNVDKTRVVSLDDGFNAATKHAIEGYSESLDHEVREHGVRVVLVEPGYARTSFDANRLLADEPVADYAQRRVWSWTG